MPRANLDYVVFNTEIAQKHGHLKGLFELLIGEVEELGPSRPASLALTKLEEAFMWTGKALRDQQLETDGLRKA